MVTNQNNGSQSGALTGSDGRYTVVGLRAGVPYLVDVRMIGYGRQAVDGVTLTPGQTMELNFTLTQEAVRLDALEVFATRAEERTTPVAFSNVGKVEIQQQLGSRDLPLVLNVTPSVYSTQAGGELSALATSFSATTTKQASPVTPVTTNDSESAGSSATSASGFTRRTL